MSDAQLVLGQRVAISDKDGQISEALLIEIDSGQTVLKIREDDGREVEFGYKSEHGKRGWKMLFEDPMQPRVTCYSQRAPFYTIEVVEPAPASVAA